MAGDAADKITLTNSQKNEARQDNKYKIRFVAHTFESYLTCLVKCVKILASASGLG